MNQPIDGDEMKDDSNNEGTNRYKFKHVHSVSCEAYCRGEESCDCGAINQPHTIIKESGGTDLATQPAESPHSAQQQGQLTPEQIKNWRTAMVGMLGPYALIMPEDQIQQMRNKMQEWANDEARLSGDSIR